MPEIKLPSGQMVLFDEQDRDLVTFHSWFFTPNGYACTKIKTDTGKKRTIGMHRLILGDPPTQAIDHKNRNRLDNRRENLEPCSQSRNMANRDFSKLRENKSSGFWGVSKRKNGRYHVVVAIKKKAKFMGSFNTEREAVDMAMECWRLIHGDKPYMMMA